MAKNMKSSLIWIGVLPLAILVFEKLLFYRPDTRRGAWAIVTTKKLLKSFG